MKRSLFVPAAILLFATACKRDAVDTSPTACDMATVYAANEQKPTVANGVWGTVAFTEGNCMPTIGPTPNSCKTCPVRRTVQVYEYTQPAQAVPQGALNFFDRFTTRLVAETQSDDNGFFELVLQPGLYTVVVIENGKLYAFGLDGQGGISPLNVSSGRQKHNLTLLYKAVF